MPGVVCFHEFGGPEGLKIEDVASMQPSKDEVALAGQPIGLNRPDSMFMHGHCLEQKERRRP
jgi:NADPH:quinone reductase-like Zn-dependent oxidoreductase